ncbi:MAG: polyphosphate kinase 1 [Opitutaceae bacterium]|nr:polyphosphate kinase 1 [Opitutaceae bacterium]
MAKSIHRSSKKSPAKAHTYPYFNRELSWLAFNRRVLQQAFHQKTPLLERLKFLAIVSSNLDEFFEIRVAGLIQQVESNVTEKGIDGLNPKEQLRRIHSVVASLVEDQYRCWHDILIPSLKKERIHFKTASELTQKELAWLKRYFEKQVFPVLTPLAVDPSHPFPQIGNKTLNVLVELDYPDTPKTKSQIAILPVPRILPRLVRIQPESKGPRRYIFLSEVIKLCAEKLFPGCRVLSAKAFRITRNSDLYIDDEESENLLMKIEEELRNLRRGAAVRLEIEEGVDEKPFKILLDNVNLPKEYVFQISGPLNLLRLFSVYEAIDQPNLKEKPFIPAIPKKLKKKGSIFQTITQQDILLHHPYESFQPVIDFIEQAGIDPNVYAIKQTLYRTSGDSPIIRALIKASQKGKQVTALIELKARFDEANNIQWARQMEEAGVHVVYGVAGLKVHCKCCLIIRKSPTGDLQHLVHLGTGNYNPKTARLYTDFSFFTARKYITNEVALLFNSMTGYGRPHQFKHLLVAPYNLHTQIQKRIHKETRNAEAGKPAHIRAQINSLIDKETINNLYQASQAGVQIDLIVRGICGLVPGLDGISENIRVRSVVGRFLEHSRALYFHNADGEPDIFLGSSDWMPRNFLRRIEVLFPIEDPFLRKRLITDFFPHPWTDTENATELRSNGAYEAPTLPKNSSPFSTQTYLLSKITSSTN